VLCCLRHFEVARERYLCTSRDVRSYGQNHGDFEPKWGRNVTNPTLGADPIGLGGRDWVSKMPDEADRLDEIIE